jgi:hypothetical protein
MSIDIPIRTGDYVSAMRVIDSLNQQIAELESLSDSWVLRAEKNVVKDEHGFGFSISFTKGNGAGFIKNISSDDVAYYANDPDSLILSLVDDIIEYLYKDKIRADITPIITGALSNALLMTSKSS